PIYLGGQLQSQIEIRTAEQKQAVAEYARVGARAFSEVESALSVGFALEDREAILKEAVADNSRALEFTNVRYRVGVGDLPAVQVATYTGPTIGGLLNASFGNAPELIVALVALRAGLLNMVRASLIGGILANLLLALGLAFLAGGLRYHTQTYNAAAARLYGSMMLIASFSLIVPSAFSRF